MANLNQELIRLLDALVVYYYRNEQYYQWANSFAISVGLPPIPNLEASMLISTLKTEFVMSYRICLLFRSCTEHNTTITSISTDSTTITSISGVSNSNKSWYTQCTPTSSDYTKLPIHGVQHEIIHPGQLNPGIQHEIMHPVPMIQLNPDIPNQNLPLEPQLPRNVDMPNQNLLLEPQLPRNVDIPNQNLLLEPQLPRNVDVQNQNLLLQPQIQQNNEFLNVDLFFNDYMPAAVLPQNDVPDVVRSIESVNSGIGVVEVKSGDEIGEPLVNFANASVGNDVDRSFDVKPVDEICVAADVKPEDEIGEAAQNFSSAPGCDDVDLKPEDEIGEAAQNFASAPGCDDVDLKPKDEIGVAADVKPDDEID